jgi:hypothetical protein
VGALVRKKNEVVIGDLRIGKLMEDYGFNPRSATSTARALILNLVRSAYGPEAAREFMRQMNLEQNPDVEVSVAMEEFKSTLMNKREPIERQETGPMNKQLSLFDLANGQKSLASKDDISSTFRQKKSRRA